MEDQRVLLSGVQPLLSAAACVNSLVWGGKKNAFKAFVYYWVLSGRALYLKSFWNEEKYPPKIVPSLFTTADFLQSL